MNVYSHFVIIWVIFPFLFAFKRCFLLQCVNYYRFCFLMSQKIRNFNAKIIRCKFVYSFCPIVLACKAALVDRVRTKPQNGVLTAYNEFIMAAVQIYNEDYQIAKALISRDEKVTREYYYKECYPLFKAIYDNYYTDCSCCKEFMDEIYIVIISPGKKTGKCQLENYKGESKLKSWLKAVCLYHCYSKYKLKPPIFEPLPLSESWKVGKDEDDLFGGARKIGKEVSNPIDFSGMNRSDVEILLSMMPNKNYRKLIELRYLKQWTNEETANELGVNMANYYNMHHRAKEQYDSVCRKEEKNG